MTHKSYKRVIEFREPYDLVLIVCEGRKSEPNYFKDLRSSYRLSAVNIEITPADGSDPMSIVHFAEEKIKISRDIKNPYDKVYCVFDRDEHKNYFNAINRINNSQDGKDGKLIAITSWACFEIWVLLHHIYNTAPFNSSGAGSPCMNLNRKVEDLFPKYKKGQVNLFSELKENMKEAIIRAKNLEKHNKETKTDNPSTKIHHLVEYLTSLSKEFT